MKKNCHLKGIAALEFALVLPVFLILLFGLIDLGRYYFTEQAVSHTLRSTARYAVTGQLGSNAAYNPASLNSFPYMNRRDSIIAIARANNPGFLAITSTPTNSPLHSNDNFKIASTDNLSNAWRTDYCGLGGDYIKLSLTNSFSFWTPFLNMFAQGLAGKKFKVGGTLILKSESFSTNEYPAVNALGNPSNNYWN